MNAFLSNELHDRARRLCLSSSVGLAIACALLWWLPLPAKLARAAGVVTICDEANLLTALNGGGLVTFACSGTITFSSPITSGILINTDTTIDATGQHVILDGENARRIFFVNTGVTLTVTNLILQRGFANGSNGDGGAIYSGGSLVLNNVRVLSNTVAGANNEGGGVFAFDALTITHGEFRNNRSLNSFGGGLRARATTVISETRFISNTAASNGGGIHATGAITIIGGELRANHSDSLGGGLSGAATFISSTRFMSNTALQGGGANVQGVLTVTNALFSANDALRGAGLRHSGSGAGRIINSLFVRNSTPISGSILQLLPSGVVEVIHTTIASPTLSVGAAISISSGATIAGISNTLIASYTTGLWQTSGAVYENHNLFFNVPIPTAGVFVSGSGANNVGGHPNFVNPANDDYHLGAGSAALNVGGVSHVTTDGDGEERPVGSGPDIGYDEVQEPISDLSVTNASPTPIGQPTWFTATISTGSSVVYTWDFGDGVSARSGARVAHTFPTIGAYTVVVTAQNSLNELTATTSVIITISHLYAPLIVR